MQFQDIFSKVKEQFGGTDTSSIKGLLAIQFNLTGEGSGTFYTEVKDGVLSIEPYEYNDRNAALTMSGDDFLLMLRKKLDPVAAFSTGRLRVEGDIGKALEITRFL